MELGELEVYLDDDVTEELIDLQQIFTTISTTSNHPGYYSQMMKIQQCLMDFEVYRKLWNTEKNKEIQLVLQRSIQVKRNSTTKPFTAFFKKQMKDQLILGQRIAKDNNVQLEFPILKLIPLAEVAQALMRVPDIGGIPIPPDFVNNIYQMIQNGTIPTRYHDHMKGLHSESIEDLLIAEKIHFEGIPLNMNVLEFPDQMIWILLESIQPNWKKEKTGLFSTGTKIVIGKPKTFMFIQIGFVGRSEQNITQNDIQRAVNVMLDFYRNPNKYNVKFHVLKHALEEIISKTR